jgi:hypothetical protein
VSEKKDLVQLAEEDAHEKKSGIHYRSRLNQDSDYTTISNRNDEDDSSEDEEIVPGAFAVGDGEERRHKGRLTASTNATGGVDMHVTADMHMGVYMEEENSLSVFPSEFQAEVDDETIPAELVDETIPAEPVDETDPNERKLWFTKRETLLALGCFLLVGLPLSLGLGLALNKDTDDGGNYESPTSDPTPLPLHN